MLCWPLTILLAKTSDRTHYENRVSIGSRVLSYLKTLIPRCKRLAFCACCFATLYPGWSPRLAASVIDYIYAQSLPSPYRFSVLFSAFYRLERSLWVTKRSNPLCHATTRVEVTGTASANLHLSKWILISQGSLLTVDSGVASVHSGSSRAVSENRKRFLDVLKISGMNITSLSPQNCACLLVVWKSIRIFDASVVMNLFCK